MSEQLNIGAPRGSKKVVWTSAGVSSFIAGYLAQDVDEWIYIDVANQHPDSLRFIHDLESFLGKGITVLKSDRFSSVEDVIRKTGMVNTPHGAPCTGMLKKAVRKKWENEQYALGITDLTYVWGMDASKRERERASHMKENFPEFTHEFPLIERGLTKNDCHYLLDQLGIKRPVMYDLGYDNNNCIGCVKGGMWYWNKIRIDFPEVFEKMAKLEREVGHSCINGCFLDELEKGRGTKGSELTGDCSVACYFTASEKGLL